MENENISKVLSNDTGIEDKNIFDSAKFGIDNKTSTVIPVELSEDNETIAIPNELKVEYDKQFKAFISDDEPDYSQFSEMDSLNNLSDMKEFAKLMSVIKKHNNNEKFNYYEELPDALKQYIMEIKSSTPNNKVSENIIAKKLIQEFASSYKEEIAKTSGYDLDTVISGLNSEPKTDEEMVNEIAASVRDLMYDVDADRRANLDIGIKRFTEEGKLDIANKLQAVKDSLEKAYSLTEFIEFCLHCKIKNHDIKKPRKIYSGFYYKYDKANKEYVNIYDIAECPKILSFHLPEYNDTHKHMLCIAFCKYCEGFDPTNVEQHTFMYYFIRNIILMDQINPKGRMHEMMIDKYKTFYDEFSANLSKCIFNLLERNTTFK